MLDNKVALITGASKGIGYTTARLFASHGATLVLVSRDIERLEIIQQELELEYESHVHCFQADVRNESELKEVFSNLRKEKIYLDVLVNNAGIMEDSVLQTATSEMIKKIYETNVYGTFYSSRLAIKSMIRNRKGSIINLSSILGTNGNLGQTIYGSSKSAIIGFTKSLSKELASLNIRVNALAPGFIDTDMTKGMAESFYHKNLGSIGMKRIGQPEDVAKVALFLASDLSDYVTGQVIGVDGGMII